MGEGKPIKILLLEDDAGDFLLIREYLAEGMKVPYMLEHADRLSTAFTLLGQGGFDVLLLDLGLPDAHRFEGFDRIHSAAPSLPVLVLTGRDDDEVAIEAVQKGAQDYLVKGQVSSSLLVRAIRYAIERQKLNTQLENSIKEIKTLRGFLPICGRCKKIRDDKGYWTQMEAYISEHTEAEFSHGLCPECYESTYSEFQKMKK